MDLQDKVDLQSLSGLYLCIFLMIINKQVFTLKHFHIPRHKT